MELVRPNVEIWEQGDTIEDMWKHIARCTRVCYQSTPKENGETDEKFVKRVILKGNLLWRGTDFDKIHGAMLEHGTVYLKVCRKEAIESLLYTNYLNNNYSKILHRQEDDCFYVTTNLRVIYENDWLADLKYICAPTEYHAKRVTVSFTTNIGVTREFNRHRVNSIAEESTRYCNYNKRNDGQIKIGLPAWLLDNENMGYIEHNADDELHSYCTEIADGDDTDWCDIDYYLFALTCAEYCYNNLIRKGWKPQQAREVLPLATKSQLIHTAFIDDWKHFFALRADGVSGPPHPNAKLVAKPLKDEFIKRGYI
jgi:thymidylate synthase (FAD)